jgi:diacylglycerol kinase family enzyme
MTMQHGHAVVLINATAGQGCPLELGPDLQEQLRRRGLQARVTMMHSGKELLAAALSAVKDGSSMVVAAGGDGTVSAVASQLAGTDTVLGVLPMGTLNHFAKDLGIPLALDAALDVLAQGRVAQVDVAEVNGRVFINNSSIGIYPDIVLDRERQRRRLGRGKWPALAVATLGVLQRHPSLAIQLEVGGEQQKVRRSPFIFIGNNRYEIGGFEIGNRRSLDGARLCLYMAHHGGRFGLLRLAVRALMGTLRQADDFDMLEAAEFTIKSARRSLRVAMDGEVVLMEPPLRYRTRAAALRVMRP